RNRSERCPGPPRVGLAAGRHAARLDLDVDVGRSSEQRFLGWLDRLAVDIREYVRAARGLQHVVETAAPAADVQPAQRAWLAAEDQQRARPRSPPNGCANTLE